MEREREEGQKRDGDPLRGSKKTGENIEQGTEIPRGIGSLVFLIGTEVRY